MSKRFTVYGAFDRMNYGDLLFAILLDRSIPRLVDGATVDPVGIVASDMAPYGGLNTESIRGTLRRYKKEGPSPLIVAGGEVLGLQWPRAIFYLDLGRGPTQLGLKVLRNTYYIRRYYPAVLRALYGGGLRTPFAVPANHAGMHFPVAYNAVGATRVLDAPHAVQRDIGEALSQASYISARDQRSKKNLESLLGGQVPVELAPDSAIVMSKEFPVESLNSLVSSALRRLLDELGSGNYVVFQCGLGYLSDSTSTVASQLTQIAKTTKMPVVLLPLGIARGHSDEEALGAVASLLDSSIYHFAPCKTVYDMMLTIANAALFCGTSLHGNITAISYGVPHVGLTRKQLKLPCFLETWDITAFQECCEFEEMARAADKALKVPKERMIENRDRLIKQYEASLASEIDACLG